MMLCDSLVDVLKKLNVGYLFGISGANIEHLHDAVHRRGGDQLTSVLSKTETGAAFMADCHARVHRKLGVCCSTSGGGMMNLIVGVAESYSESVPLLAIVGQPPTAQAGRGAFQDSSGLGRSINALAMWQSVTKYTAVVEYADQWWDQLAQALGEASGGRPGPTALLIPRDKFELDVGELPVDWSDTISGYLPELPDNEEVRRLFDTIQSAQSPVFILGQGVRRCSSPDAVINFAKQTGIPVITTPSARAEYPNDLPNYLGVCGIVGLPSVHEYIEHTADLYILVGTSLDIMSRGPLVKCIEEGKRACIVNIHPKSVHIDTTDVETVTGDAGVIFTQLLNMDHDRPCRHGPVNYCKTWIKPGFSEVLDADIKGELLLSQAIGILGQHMPDSGHIILDAGNCAATALHLMDVPNTLSSTIALGMGGMGYSVAGAIGAQLGSPEGTHTVVIVGDAAFLMTGFELNTAVELKLPILVIVFNNNMHGMCALRQKLYFESRFECVSFKSPVDFPALARSLGGSGQLWTKRATSAKELEFALNEYYAGPVIPGLLEICLGLEEMPPFLPFMTADTEFTDQRPV